MNVAGVYHFEEYLVFTKDKNLSIFQKRQIRDKIRDFDAELIPTFKENLTGKCWGEDVFTAQGPAN